MISTVLLTKPKHLKKAPDSIMSNFDCAVNTKIKKLCEKGAHFAQYSGWNFCGYVWKAEGKWACEIWRYHIHIETLTGTLGEIMSEAQSKWGEE